ncbi:hypothetical protein AKO1_013586 [Acrasis kona]|uniref:Uncharacterized protein n=1 Tax=Acrasis kona TaxID=1008807 RepID=A0AAW2YVV3_9EUKA
MKEDSNASHFILLNDFKNIVSRVGFGVSSGFIVAKLSRALGRIVAIVFGAGVGVALLAHYMNFVNLASVAIKAKPTIATSSAIVRGTTNTVIVKTGLVDKLWLVAKNNAILSLSFLTGAIYALY